MLKDLKVGQVVRFKTDGWTKQQAKLGYDSSVAVRAGDVGQISHATGKYAQAQTERVQAVLGVLDPDVEFEVIEGKERQQWLKDKMKRLLSSTTSMIRISAGHMTGADPEIFVLDGKEEVIPAWKFLPDKKHGLSTGNNGQAFWDGFQAEFTILAGHCHGGVHDRIRSALMFISKKAQELDPKAKLTNISTIKVKRSVLKSVSDEHAALGCAPSLNVYTEVEPLTVPDPRSMPFRTAGCHIHFGCKGIKADEVVRVVKSMDRNYAVLSVAALQGLEAPERRMMYGRAGEHRLPPHGLEYRVPSSSILCNSVVSYWNFDTARCAFNLPNLGYENLIEVPGGDEQVQEIVNFVDVDQAKAIVKKNKAAVEVMMRSMYGAASIKKLYDAILNGFKEHLNVKDVQTNWTNLNSVRNTFYKD